jgi:hypothetical protein
MVQTGAVPVAGERQRIPSCRGKASRPLNGTGRDHMCGPGSVVCNPDERVRYWSSSGGNHGQTTGSVAARLASPCALVSSNQGRSMPSNHPGRAYAPGSSDRVVLSGRRLVRRPHPSSILSPHPAGSSQAVIKSRLPFSFASAPRLQHTLSMRGIVKSGLPASFEHAPFPGPWSRFGHLVPSVLCPSRRALLWTAASAS